MKYRTIPLLLLATAACEEKRERPPPVTIRADARTSTASDANAATDADPRDADLSDRLFSDADPADSDPDPSDADPADADPRDAGDLGCTTDAAGCVCSNGLPTEATCMGSVLSICQSRFLPNECRCMGSGAGGPCAFDCFQASANSADCCDEPMMLNANSPTFSTTAIAFSSRVGCLAGGATITRIKSFIPSQGIWDSYNPDSEQWAIDGNGRRYTMQTTSIDETTLSDVDVNAGWFMVVEIGNRAFAIADNITTEITPQTFPGATDPSLIPAEILSATFAFQ